MRIRLDRWLVTLGLGSRTQVQKLIRSGAAAVDGVRQTDPSAQTDTSLPLQIGGQSVDGRLMRHVLLCKPAGLLTAARDKKQPTVMDLLPPVYTAVGCMPVGRLDKDTTGVLLLTCDGELAHRLLSPSRHVDKRYLAALDSPLPEDAEARFAAGLDLGDFTAQGALLERVDARHARVTLREGKFHQVKRMFEAVGCTVEALHREAFGPLTPDSGMQPGDWRELRAGERAALYAAAGMEETHE